MNFSYTPERLKALERSISAERLSHYMDEASDDLEAAIRLYEHNARLSAALYGPLQCLEVTIRNAINDQFCERFGPNWYDLEAIKLQPVQVANVQDAIREASELENGDTIEPTLGQIIAELRFAFWVGVLGPKNETELWRKALYNAFPHRPKVTERKQIHNSLNKLRRLRNRIAHHCRILHRDLVEDHTLILEAIGWVCPETREWIAVHSTFEPGDLPVTAETLPIEGIPAFDPVSPKPPLRGSRNGRPILSIKKG